MQQTERIPDVKMKPFSSQCMTCATTHIENGKEITGTLHCKDPKYAHLIGARCWDYTEKEEENGN